MPRPINILRALLWGFLPSCLSFSVVAHAAPRPAIVSPDIVSPNPTYGMPMPRLASPASALDHAPAHWIWLGPVEGDQQFWGRTTFTLRSKPRTAHVWATGDDAFTLFIIGVAIGV